MPRCVLPQTLFCDHRSLGLLSVFKGDNKTRLAPVLSGVGVLLAAVIINASVGSSLGMAAGLLALSLNYLIEGGSF